MESLYYIVGCEDYRQFLYDMICHVALCQQLKQYEIRISATALGKKCRINVLYEYIYVCLCLRSLQQRGH